MLHLSPSDLRSKHILLDIKKWSTPEGLLLLILFGRLPEVKLGPQTRACAVPFVYVVAVETSILEVLAPFASTALLQLLHIGLLVSFGFPCSVASYPKYFQIALLLCSLSTKAGCGGAALAIFIFTSLLLFNQSEWGETRDRHCGHVWCLPTRLLREVKVTARLGSVYRYFGKLVLVPFRYFSIDIYRNIDIFDNTTLGVDRLSAWPIIGADIKHFTDYRYRPF